MITVLSLIVGAFIIGFLVTAVALFINWLLHHPAHIVCKELPPRTEPCKHERFVMDKQIRLIQCKQCGMRSWLEKDHVDLFPPKN